MPVLLLLRMTMTKKTMLMKTAMTTTAMTVMVVLMPTTTKVRMMTTTATMIWVVEMGESEGTKKIMVVVMKLQLIMLMMKIMTKA